MSDRSTRRLSTGRPDNTLPDSALPGTPRTGTPARRHAGRSPSVWGAAAVATAVAALGAVHAAGAPANDAKPVMVVRQGDKLVVPAESPLRTRLVVSPAQSSTAPHDISLPATVEADPARTVNVLPPLAGRLGTLAVSLGDTVKAGQLLATVRSPDLDQAYADVDKAHDALELARKALQRARGVQDAGANAVKDLEQADSNYEQALAEAQRADARLLTLNGNVRSRKARVLSITAPVSGTVTALNYGAGSYINDPTVALMTITNLDKVWVTANVPENLIGSVAKGAPVEVELAAYAHQTMHGTVSFVGATLEPDTHRSKTRIAFDNRAGKLKPNMYATVHLAVPQSPQVVVPTSALLMNNDATTVFVQTAPWTFVRRAVEVGQEDGERVRILSGLAAGEQVVVRGGVLLND